MNGVRVGDLFMSLIHHLRTEQGQSVRLRDGAAPASRGSGGASGGVDAVELQARGDRRCRVISLVGHMAESIPLRPYKTNSRSDSQTSIEHRKVGEAFRPATKTTEMLCEPSVTVRTSTWFVKVGAVARPIR
jgi:hypothetical protein